MSRIGYYRYKFDNLSAAQVTKNITFYVDGIEVVTHTININSFCEGEKLLKYIDKDGQYRFIAFNKYWEGRNTPEMIGSTNNIVQNILNAQSNQKSLGYKNKKTLTLIKNNVTDSELLLIQQLLTSPRVYLLIGSNDNAEDWLLVTSVKSADNIYKFRKKINSDFIIDIELPEDFSQTML